MTVRTRFAPSPTGYMHIGGMRTALFNWLWARHNGGTFILRIDDTDQQRNVDEALEPILDAFRWLGLNWDEGVEVGGDHGPYFQSQRSDLYEAAVDKLLASGQAYKDFDDPQQTQADRELAEKEKRPYLSARRSLELSDEQIAAYEAEGRKYVIRFKVDYSQKLTIQDHVRGKVEWDCSIMSDPAIMRGGGAALYNLATVVDDAAMNITHVVRAEEHLSNTPTQLMLFDALGYARPEFAHIPFVAGPDGKKLSKRAKYVEMMAKHRQFQKLFKLGDEVFGKLGLDASETLNPVMVAFYREVGFLPEAILNGLSRLGWSYDDKTENMSLDFVTENFTLDRVVKGSAKLDPDKLMAYQEHWFGELSVEDKVNGSLPYLIQAGLIEENVDADQRDYIGRLVTAVGDRLKLYSDILTYDEYFVSDSNLHYDEKAFQKRIAKPENAKELLKLYADQLAEVDDFTAANLETHLKSWLDEQGREIGEIIHALRVAVSGKAAGPGMFDCLELLGKDRCLNRINRAINHEA